MRNGCRDKFNKDNVLLRAMDTIGITGLVGANLYVVPAWHRDESGQYQMDGILYGLFSTTKENGEWSPPQGIIRDVLHSPALIWLPDHSEAGEPSPYRRAGEPSKWLPLSHGDDWWNASERIIGCCLEIGELFQQRNQDVLDRDAVFLHSVLLRRFSADYRVVLPPELFAPCRALYPDFFDWLSEGAKK